jgi:DNA-binding NtrC family response regulator
MNQLGIFIVGDDRDSVQRLKVLTAAQGYPVLGAAVSLHDNFALELVVDRRIGVVIIASASQASVDLVRDVRLRNPSLPVIMAPDESSQAQAIAAFRAGASDYLQPPVSISDLLSCLKRWLSARATGSSLHDLLGGGELIGNSTAMQDIKNYMKKVALTDSNILITGETGTGKDLVAGLIHRNSARKEKSFVCLNCAAIPETLLESELFGYERGAFTGAVSAQKGKFELAHGGTLFLDEIGEMGPIAQAKILRAIDTKQICRLGGQVGRQLDVRLIAATNQPLKQLVQEERFRKDLFFRLNVTSIDVPPLRSRREDIPALLKYFIHDLNQRWGRAVQDITPDAMKAFVHYDWPGNVRELKNVLESLFVEPDLSQIDCQDLPEDIQANNIGKEISSAERQRIVSVLALTKWNKTRAAEQLNWSRMTLYRKLAKYQIELGLPARI